MIMRLCVSQEVMPQGINDIALTFTFGTWHGRGANGMGEVLSERRRLPELLA